MLQLSPRARRLALVAEDDPIILMETVDTLADAGFEVLEAYDAQQALAQLDANRDVMLLVTDVRMPGPVQGFELARLVHARWPAIAVLVCSGYRRPPAGELPVCVQFLGKPISGDGLARALTACGLT